MKFCDGLLLGNDKSLDNIISLKSLIPSEKGGLLLGPTKLDPVFRSSATPDSNYFCLIFPLDVQCFGAWRECGLLLSC